MSERALKIPAAAGTEGMATLGARVLASPGGPRVPCPPQRDVESYGGEGPQDSKRPPTPSGDPPRPVREPVDGRQGEVGRHVGVGGVRSGGMLGECPAHGAVTDSSSADRPAS